MDERFKIDGLLTLILAEFLPKSRFQREYVFCRQCCLSVYKELVRHRAYRSLNAIVAQPKNCRLELILQLSLKLYNRYKVT
jgi:hypothetical protein